MDKNKEQIIIDGINVVDCNYIIDHDPPKKQGTWGGAIHKGACKIYSKDCKHNPDCYFKQLARKTQECEELKKQLVQKDEINTFFNTPIEGWSSNPCDICENKNNYEQLKEDYAELKQECGRLKSYGATLLADKTAMEIGRDDYMQRCKRLEQECEELKKELDKEHLLMLEKQDKATRYFLVLNGIKEYIYNNTDFDVNDSIQSKTSGYDILQIIKDV